MIVDANANIGPTVYQDFEFKPTLADLTRALEDAGIDRAVVAPLTPPSLDYDQANGELAARIEEQSAFVGIGRIDPRIDGSAGYAETALTEYDLHGLKLHPWEESFPITAPYVRPIFEVARKYNVPVWIYAGYPGVSHALSIREVARAFSDVDIILTHGAQLDISGLSLSDATLLARETENTYFELSGVYRRDLIEDLTDIIGADRMLFGTNAPYFHPTVEKSRIATAQITDDEKEFILGKTIETLL